MVLFECIEHIHKNKFWTGHLCGPRNFCHSQVYHLYLTYEPAEFCSDDYTASVCAAFEYRVVHSTVSILLLSGLTSYYGTGFAPLPIWNPAFYSFDFLGTVTKVTLRSFPLYVLCPKNILGIHLLFLTGHQPYGGGTSVPTFLRWVSILGGPHTQRVKSFKPPCT